VTVPFLTVSTFATFAGLLVAGRKLATTAEPTEWLKALSDLASNGAKLKAVLDDRGLSPLAAKMTKVAEETARHFTHPGHARDDAVALFWQAAPQAFAKQALFVRNDLDAAAITDQVIAAIRASPLARDFFATTLPEQFFRQVAERVLDGMLTNTAFIDSIAPDLWRDSLARQGIVLGRIEAVKEDTGEILALVRDLHAMRQTTVPQDTLIAIARKISPRIADRDEALRALDAAADLAAEAQARGEAGSNVDEYVDQVLRRLGQLTAEGRLDEAARAADEAVAQHRAGLSELIDAAIRQHLLAFDAESAARQITRRLSLDLPDRQTLFVRLGAMSVIWLDSGHDKGLRLDLEVAIALSRASLDLAGDADDRGGALNALGVAQATLGAREPSTARLEAAVEAFRRALPEYARGRVPRDWAMTQMNLGNALRTLGEREAGTARLEEAVRVYEEALKEFTRGHVPMDWARTQMNLGNALLSLGEREPGTARLEAAVAAFKAALQERTRHRVPLDWAMTQMNLGNALQTLGGREPGTALLEAAVEAYEAALEERTRDRVPLDWARTKMNLGSALVTLGEREPGIARLEAAVAAFEAALEEQTRDRVPLVWAGTQMNLGNALRALGQREPGTARLEAAVSAFEAALQELTRDRVPLDWAGTIYNRALATFLISERGGDALTVKDISQLSEAAAVLRDGGHLVNAEIAEQLLSAIDL
jgi:tetratricopeptide (TPR) repeat protein